MGEKYRICLIMPSGYEHSLLFTEPVFLLRAAFEDLGIDYTVGVNELDKDRVNVILGYHLLTFGENLHQYRYIPYQFEQLGEGGGTFDNENARNILKHAVEVWDYSRQNVEVLRGAGIKAKYLPVGFHEALETIPDVPDKDIDVLFFGSMNDRRRTILQELQKDQSVRVEALFGVYGKARDEKIARAKINLHIHFYDTKIYQQLRVAHFSNNRRFVISEESRDNPYPEVPIRQVPYLEMVETCKFYLAHPEERDRLANEAYEAFKSHYHMTELVRQAL